MKEQIYSYPHGATKLVNLLECAAVGERKKEKGKQFTTYLLVFVIFIYSRIRSTPTYTSALCGNWQYS